MDGIFQSGGLERFRRAAGVYGWGGLDDRLRRFPPKH